MMMWFNRHSRMVVCILLILVVLVVIGLVFRTPAAVETGSWGLSFQQEGEPPVGNATPAALKKYDAAFLGDGKAPILYLTFDCGYENGVTGQILDVLKAHDVKACFFLVGNFVDQNPELVQRMVDEGHTVGNHTWHHYDMARIADRETFEKELSYVEDKFREVTGRELDKYYRPPQGIYSEENLKMAQELGYHTVFWSLAYVDWNNNDQPSKEEAFSKLIPRVHNGAVVLLHATSKTNGAILDDLLTKWEEMGYRFATVEELFGGAVTN